MLTVVRCLYRPGGAEERLHIRDVHVEYMIANRQWLEQGGALMSSDGMTVEGMFLILRHDSREDVETFLSNEPYNRAGVFESTTIERMVGHYEQVLSGMVHDVEQPISTLPLLTPSAMHACASLLDSPRHEVQSVAGS